LNDSESSGIDSLWNVRSELQRAERARTEHLKVLLRHSIFIFLGNIAGSVTLAVGLWTTARQGLLTTWLLVMIIFNFARWLAARRLPTGFIDETQTRFWEKLFVASVAISGVLWGAAGGLFYVPDQPEQGLFLALLIVGMCSAATSSLSYHRIAYPVFLLPAITPIMLHLIADEKLAANAIGFVIPFYFTLLYLLSREIYRTAHESIIERINSQYQANFDHLTGVANRRGFEEAMEREWYRAMRDKHVLSLIIADIDNFKRCNDTHGYEAGDLVLKSVAVFLEQRIRRGADLVARIGGGEFAIILPATDLHGAVALAKSIRLDMRKLANNDDKEMFRVTMNFGVSSLVPDSSIDERLLFRQADAAVYKAKKKGKDRIAYLGIG
jgi:diguanylate cyclase (GGDEF)-like protein